MTKTGQQLIILVQKSKTRLKMAAKNQIGQDPGSGLLTFVLQTPPPGNWRAEESRRLWPSLRMRTSQTRPEVEGSGHGRGCCRSPRLSASFRTLWRGRNWTDCVLLRTCEIRQHKEPKMKQLLSKGSSEWMISRGHQPANLLPGTANGLLPARRSPCSDWLDEEELEDLPSIRAWERCSSRGFCLFQTTIWGEDAIPVLLQSKHGNRL